VQAHEDVAPGDRADLTTDLPADLTTDLTTDLTADLIADLTVPLAERQVTEVAGDEATTSLPSAGPA
jgi:hypothetical protein